MSNNQQSKLLISVEASKLKEHSTESVPGSRRSSQQFEKIPGSTGSQPALNAESNVLYGSDSARVGGERGDFSQINNIETWKLRCKLSEEENKTLRDDLEASHIYADEIREERKELKASLETASKHHTKRLNDVSSSYQTTIRNLEAEIFVLKRQVKGLETERDTTRPLVEVAKDIRSRFLEQAKSVEGNASHHTTNKTIVQRGNKAAHNAIGKVDKALFDANLFEGNQRLKMATFFMKLYKSSPKDYGSISEKMQKVIDCEATIKTLAVVNHGLRPLTQRQLAMEQIEFLFAKYQKMAINEFEADQDIGRRVLRVIDLTDEIVEADRKRKVTT